MSLFRNKLYKLFMVVFAFIITCIIAYVLGLMVSSVVLSVLVVSTKHFTDFFLDNYIKFWLLSGIVPAVPFLITIWKGTSGMAR